MKFGSADIDAVKLGSTDVDAVYIGSTKVWPTTPPYTPPNYVSSGLVAYYDPKNPLSYSGSGTTLTDLSTQGNNGTVVGATYDSNGYFTTDGVDDYIVTPNLYTALTTNGEDHTVEMWVYSNAVGECLWSDLGTSNNPATSTYHFAGAQLLQVGPFQQIISALWNGTATTRSIGASGTLTGAWKHVVRTYSGTTLLTYVNASTAGPATVAFDSPIDDGYNHWYLAFGAEDTTTYSGSVAGWLDGRIGIMRVYNRALSGTEVTSNYNDAKSIYGL